MRFSSYATATDVNLLPANAIARLSANMTNTTLSASRIFNAVLLDNSNGVVNLSGNAGVTLSLFSAGALAVAGGAATVSVPFVSLGTEAIVTTDTSASAVTISSVINGSGPLTLAGPGTVALASSANVYTGPTFVTGGTINIGSSVAQGNNAFGASTAGVTLLCGTLNAVNTQLGFNIPNPITLTNSNLFFTGGGILNEAQFEIFSGAVTVTTGTDNTLTVNNDFKTSQLQFTNALSSSGAITKNGTGVLSLTGASTNYGGFLTVNQGIVNSQNDSGLGAAFGTVLVASGATLQMQNTPLIRPVTISGSGMTLNGSGVGALQEIGIVATGGSNNIVLAGPASIGADNFYALQGIISGQADLTKVGLGILNLAGANTFAGNLNVNTGIAQITNAAGAWGAITGAVIVATGASVSAAVVLNAKPMTLSGTGFGANGLLGNIGALTTVNGGPAPTISGLLALNSGATIGPVGGLANSLTVTGLIVDGSGPTSLVTTSLATGSITLQNANTYTGATVINGGSLTLNNGGSILNSSSITANQSATLLIDNTTVPSNVNSLNSTVPLFLNGANFTVQPDNTVLGVPTNVTIGTITLAGGANSINLQGGSLPGTAATLTSASLSRLAGATVVFSAVNTGTIGQGLPGFNQPLGSSNARILFTNNPTTTQSILPFGLVNTPGISNSQDWASYDPTNGIVAFTNYVVSLAAAGPNSNVKLSGSETLPANKTVNSLLIVNNPNLLLAGSTLTVASGGVDFSNNGAVSINAGSINFGGSEGVIFNSTNTTTLNASITGTGGMTVSGAAAGQLNLDFAGAYSGGTTLNQGVLQLGAGAAALGAGTLTLTGGALQSTIQANISNPVAITTPNAAVAFGNTSQQMLNFTGNVRLATMATLTNTDSQGLYFSGNVAGNGLLNLAGTGPVFLTGSANSYSGGTFLGMTAPSGILVVGNGNTSGGTFLGSGILALRSGVIQSNSLAATTIANQAVFPTSSSFTVGGSKPLTITNLNVLAGGTNTLNISSTATTAITNLFGPGALTVAGNATAPGPLTLTNNTLLSGITISTNAIVEPLLSSSLGNSPLAPLTLPTISLTGTGGELLTRGDMTFPNVLSLGTLSGPSFITLAGGNRVTFTGPTAVSLTGATGLIVNDPTATFSGVLSGTLPLSVAGSGALVLTAPDTFTGAITVAAIINASNGAPGGLSPAFMNQGNLIFSGLGSALNTVGPTTINVGGNITLDNSGSIGGVAIPFIAPNRTPSRLNPTNALTMNGGSLTIVANSALPTTTQVLGALTLNQGNSVINLIGTGVAGSNVNLTFGSLVRTAGATVDFNSQVVDFGTTNANNVLTFTAAPAQSGAGTNAILPYAEVTGTGGFDFATMTGTNLVRFSNYVTATDVNLLPTGATVKLTPATLSTLTASQTFNAVMLSGANLNLTGLPGTVLTLGTSAGSVGAIAATGGVNSLSVPIVSMSTENIALTDANAQLTLNSILSQAAAGQGSLTLTGLGTVAIPDGANNAYSGGTILNSGTLSLLSTFGAVGSPLGATATGVGTLTAISGTILGNSSIGLLTDNAQTTINVPVLLQNGSITLGGTGPLLFTGGFSTATSAGMNTLTVTNSGLTQLGGANSFVSGSAPIIKAGSGTLQISSAGSGASGSFIGAVQGVLNLAADLGNSAGVYVASGAALQLQGSTITRQLTISGSGVGGIGGALQTVGTTAAAYNAQVTLAGATTIETDLATLTLGASAPNALGEVGQADITKTGLGTLVLSTSNAFAGNLFVNQGIVILLDSANAPGAITGSVVVASGATLQTNGPGMQAKPITLNGTGFAFNGQLGNLGALNANGASLLIGPVFINPGATIGAAAALTISGVVSDGPLGPADFTKTSSTSSITLVNQNTYSGATTINGGALLLNSAGSILNTTSVTINQGGAFTLDSSSLNVNVFARVSPTLPLSLNGGSLTFLGNNTFPGLASNFTVGAITLAGGANAINVQAGTIAGNSATVNSTALVRKPGSSVVFSAVNGALGTGAFGLTPALGSTGARILFGNSAALTGNSILPYALVNTPGISASQDFANYDPTNGIMAFTNYKATLAAAGPNDVVKLSSNEVISANKTVNAMMVLNGAVITPGASTLTVSSGAITFVNGGTLSGGTVSFGASEGIINTLASTTSVNAVLSGTAGLTVYGAGILNLTQNSYSGGTTLNQGVLNLANGAALGSGTLNLIAGALQSTVQATITNPVVFLTPNASVSFGNVVTPLIFTGNVNLSSMATITQNDTAGVYFNGNISGAGLLNIVSPASAPLFLNGQNSYSGGTFLGGTATLVLGNSTALGTGTLSFGTNVVIQAGQNTDPVLGVTISNPVVLGGVNPSTVTIGGSHNLTFTSNIPLLAGANVISEAGTGTTTFSGQLGGTGSLTVSAVAGIVPGPIVLSNTNNTFTSGFTLGTTGTPIVSVPSVGSLSGSVTAPQTLQTLTLTGGELIYTGTSAGTISNLMGTLGGANAISIAGSNSLTFTSSTVALAATTNLVVNVPTMTMIGILTGASALNVAGSGTLILTAPSSYTGATTVAANIAPANGAMSGAGLNSGALIFSGQGAATGSNSFVVNNGGVLLLDNSAIGTAPPAVASAGTTGAVNEGDTATLSGSWPRTTPATR